MGIMGASGSGKTTLLNCISTIDTVSAGHIYLNGTDVTEINEKQIARFRRENLGFVFQDFNLLDTLTISENIALALTINKVPAGEIDGRVREMAGISRIFWINTPIRCPAARSSGAPVPEPLSTSLS